MGSKKSYKINLNDFRLIKGAINYGIRNSAEFDVKKASFSPKVNLRIYSLYAYNAVILVGASILSATALCKGLENLIQ